jgi:hypothetical protein
VVNISRHGFWLLVSGTEHFLPFEQFPWFKDASVASILNVRVTKRNHLYWPDLDVDLTIDSIEAPERYPLVAKTR